MISWIKLDINILDDAKIKIIRSHPDGDKVVVLWIGLLCLAMKSSRPGIIEISDGLPYTLDDISNLFNIEKKTVEMGLALFRKYKMIDLFNGDTIEVINFSKHQNIEQIERNRELTRQRMIQYRKRKRDDVVTRNGVTVTTTDLDKTKTKTKTKRICAERAKTRKIFQIPSVEEISEYCKQRSNNIDPQYFYDYQKARDWILSNGKRMVDWQATIRTWEKNAINSRGNNGTTTNFRDAKRPAIYAEQERLADEINAEYYRRKAIEAANQSEGNT